MTNTALYKKLCNFSAWGIKVHISHLCFLEEETGPRVLGAFSKVTVQIGGRIFYESERAVYQRSSS